MKKTKKKIPSETSSDGCYTVIKLFENDTTLFGCIPDIWFTDENQDFCYWPPIKGKNVAIRALKQEIPDESWERYPCEVVKGGFATYSSGRALVREKCAQKYNTSSAEEHESAAKFRRQHPGLSLGVSESFDDVFKTKISTESAENHHEIAPVDVEPPKNDVIDLEQSTHSEMQILSPSEEILPRTNSPTSVTSYKTVCSMASSQNSNGSTKRRRIRPPSRQGYSPKGSYSSQSILGSRKIQTQNGSKSSTEKGKNVGNFSGKNQSCSASVNVLSITPRGQSSSTSHQKKIANSNQVDRRNCSQEPKGSSARNNYSPKRQRSRSTSRQRYSPKGSYSSQPILGSRKIQAENGSKRSTEKGGNVDNFSGKNQSCSASVNLQSITPRGKSSSTSHQNKIANANRVDRRNGSQEYKGSSARNNCSPKRQRSRSTSRQRYSPKGSYSSQSEHGSRKIKARVDRRSGSRESKGSRASSSPSSFRQRNSNQNKIANSDRVERRSGSQGSKGLSASSSYLSKHQRSLSHSRSRQSNSSNGTSHSSQSEHNSRKLSTARYGSKNSQHPGAGIDEGRPSSKNMLNSCSSPCQSQMLMTKLFVELRELTKTVIKNQLENARRMTRMEVSINKTLVRLGDITRSNAAQSRDVSRGYSNEDLRFKDAQNYGESSRRQRHEDAQMYGESSRRQRCEDAQNHSSSSRRFVNPRDQRSLPITSLNELTEANKQLMDRSFFTFLVNEEKEFCMPGKNTSVNVVITTYLKRFITLRVRSLLTLKELQSDQGMTLFADFYYVYSFLIEVAREGYRACNRSLSEKDANESLRIVWGRTKQLLNDEQKKKNK